MRRPTPEEIDAVFAGTHEAHHPYLWISSDGEIQIDGYMTAEHLERLAALVRKLQRDDPATSN